MLFTIVFLKVFNPDEESSDEDEEIIGNQGIRVGYIFICIIANNLMI